MKRVPLTAGIAALVLAIVVFTAGTFVDARAQSPESANRGVLIIAGEGLIPVYDDSWPSAFWFNYSKRFAEALKAEIERRGTPAELYINRDRKVDTKARVRELLGNNRRDGLIQVTVTHLRNDSENEIFLTANYTKLVWSSDDKGEHLMTWPGPSARFVIFDDMIDASHMPVYRFSTQFVRTLHKVGSIGVDQYRPLDKLF